MSTVKYSYWHFQSALTDAQCDKILNHGITKLEERKQKGESTQATTMGKTHKGGRHAGSESFGDADVETWNKVGKKDQTYIRDSEVTWLDEDWIYEMILPFVRLANENAGWNYDIDGYERFQFTKYGLNQFYGWHQDARGDHHDKYKRFIHGISEYDSGGIPAGYVTNHNNVGKVRKLSVTINISDQESYEGGNLRFDLGPHADQRYHDCDEIRPRGSIIVFPSHVYHQVAPVTSGERYSLVLWTLGYPFR